MERNYYKTPEASPLMKAFWKAAGADRYLLERSTYSDQVKYMCLGGIIVATGLMAALAGGYAFYTIFEPKGSSLESSFSWQISLISSVFGLLWGAMIFNLDRFIVSSTGKGDGTEAITRAELRNALPRLLMGAIIALTISKPVEIRMFKSEIDVALYKAQMEVKQTYLDNIETNFSTRIANEKAKIDKYEKEIRQKELRYVELENLLAREMSGANGGDRGVGPQAKKIDEQMKLLKAETESLKQGPLMRESLANLKRIEQDKEKQFTNADKVAGGLDGLLERIKLAHQIAGTVISLFITLLFMAIELTPIFFKLMLTRTPYDYLEENVKELIKAEEGILVEPDFYKDKKGQERDLVMYYARDKMHYERKALFKAQQELSELAIARYTDEMKRKIEADPSAFIQAEPGKTHGAQ